MSEKHLSEAKIQARMSTIIIPGITNLQNCYESLETFLRENEFSQEAFKAKVNDEFSAYTFEKEVENLASLAQDFLKKHVRNTETGLQVLDLLSECLGSSIPFITRAKAISILTAEALDNC